MCSVSAHLFPVYCVKGLVDEKSDGTGGSGGPGWELRSGGAVPHQHQRGHDVNGQSHDCDKVGSDPERHQSHEPASQLEDLPESPYLCCAHILPIPKFLHHRVQHGCT